MVQEQTKILLKKRKTWFFVVKFCYQNFVQRKLVTLRNGGKYEKMDSTAGNR